ncbi:MAG: alpha/beta hydrolase [Cyclobacteriaceae bacterium]
MKKVFVYLSLIFFVRGPGMAQGLKPSLDFDRSKPTAITYKVIDSVSLDLTFRYPTDFNKTKDYPTIIFFFGGGWNGGSIKQFEPHAEYFASRGMVTVLADYRVNSRHGTTPYESVADAKSAVRFLRSHAKALNIKPDQIVASGGSAGGHLAAATTTLPGLDESDEDLSVSAKANAAVLFNPVFDNGSDGFEHERMGDRWKEISPAHNIRQGTPPTIVFLGTNDHLIPVSIAEGYRDKMEKVGARCDLFLYEGEGHGFFNQSKKGGLYYYETVKEADRFLNDLGFIDGPSTIKKRLDISSYLKLGDEDVIYPNDKQLEILRPFFPEASFQPAPPITDRNYWSTIGSTPSGNEYLENAIAEIEIAPEVPIADSIYRVANLHGNRGIYKPRYYRTMTRLEHFMLAECIENEGRFLPQIETYIKAILSMKSWLHPNHDNEDNDVLEGRSMAIDLGSRRFGSDLALAEVLLGEKLSTNIREEIASKLQERIIDGYLQSTSGKVKTHLNWYRGTSNWNSVCTSGAVFVAISTSKDYNERLAAVGTALNSMRNYMRGFGDDGYCSEGAGYWNYGFGHYLYLAQTLYDYTDGAINLFEFDNPEKVENVANFPFRYQITENVCAPFADGSSSVFDDGGFASKMVVNKFGVTMPPLRERKNVRHDSFSAVYQLIEWDYMKADMDKGKTEKVDSELPGYTYFDKFGMVISRGNQQVPLSIAIKGGHNHENHNHMDVGTYNVVLGKDIMTGDIGAPSYRAGAFLDTNPARSSWGHPVPRIDNTLQSKGEEFRAEITSTEFTENMDKVIMDIKGAYEIPALKSLVRTMENDKSGEGEISITDEFSLTDPVDFGIAIMTLTEYEIVDANTVILKTENQTLKAEVSSPDGELVIKDELVPVEHLREGAPAYRIGVDFNQPIAKGLLTVKYTPILSN